MPQKIASYKSKEEGDKAAKEAIKEIHAKQKKSSDKWIKDNLNSDSEKKD